MEEYKVVREIGRKEWSEFVFNHPYGNIFQTPEIFDVFKATKNHEPVFLAAMDSNDNILGTLLAVIQKEHQGVPGNFTARSIVWGGPLIRDNKKELFELILRKYNKLIESKAIYSQFRNLWAQQYEKEVFKNDGFLYDEHLNIIVNLEKSEEQLWKEVHSKRRNEIRRAKKEGTKFKELLAAKEIDESYNILIDVYRKVKRPIADKSLFNASADYLLEKKMIKHFGAINNNKVIGTIVVLCFKDKIYDWYAGSYRDYLNKYPNDLLPWEVFLWGKKNGFKTFDFGGAGKPGKPYGVRDYKKKFGGKFVNFGRYEKIHKPVLMKIARVGFKLWQSVR